MNNNVKSRLLDFIAHIGMNVRNFEVQCKLSNGFVKNISKGIGAEKLRSILQQFPQLNSEWLLTGEGEMLISPPCQPDKQSGNSAMAFNLVPLIPVGAFAGSVKGFSSEGVELSHCDKVVSPVHGADIAIDVTGDSMEPDFPNGCRVFCARIYEESFIAWGNTFVVDTVNGAFLKRIFPSSEEPTAIEARSNNRDYPAFLIPKSSVFGIYRVLMMARGYSLY